MVLHPDDEQRVRVGPRPDLGRQGQLVGLQHAIAALAEERADILEDARQQHGDDDPGDERPRPDVGMAAPDAGEQRGDHDGDREEPVDEQLVIVPVPRLEDHEVDRDEERHERPHEPMRPFGHQAPRGEAGE